MTTPVRILIPGSDPEQYLEGVIVTLPAGDAIREGVTVSDPDDPLGRARVLDATPVATAFGLVVRTAGPVEAQDTGEREYDHITGSRNSAGTSTLHTPAAGKAIRVRKIMVSSRPDLGFPEITVAIGALVLWIGYNGIVLRQVKTGAVDDVLTITTDAAGAVRITVILEEV